MRDASLGIPLQLLRLLFYKEVRVVRAFLKQVKFIWSVNLTCLAVLVLWM